MELLRSCNVVPSCLITKASFGTVSVLANGGPYLYLIGSEQVVSVKFAKTDLILHVSPLLCPRTQQTLALCCLSNGDISALSIQSATSKSDGESTKVDILSSLFDCEAESSFTSTTQVTDGREHSLSLFHFSSGQLQCSLQCALVHNGKLMLVVRNKHSSFLNVYHSSSHSQFQQHQLPLFAEPYLFQHKMGSFGKISNSLPLGCVTYRPALLLLSCQPSAAIDNALMVSSLSSATDIFFRQLFGLELTLARSTVVLVGTQSGPVLFFDIRNYCNSSCSTNLDAFSSSNTLCNLDQPVVAIHALSLPTSAQLHKRDDPLASVPANGLLVVGKSGKVVLFSQAEKGRDAPTVSTFYLAGPILSSVLVERHSFAYSTTRGIYRVCLEPSCITKSFTDTTLPPVVLPHLQFHSPFFTTSTCTSFITEPFTQSVDGEYTGWALGVTGKVFTFHLKSCQQLRVEPLDVGRKIKERMSSIKMTADKTSKFQSQLELVDSALKELNEAFMILLSAKSSEAQIFSCIISPVIERVGVRCLSTYAEVELSYSGVGKLQRGWGLLLAVQCATSTNSRYTSVSLDSLSSSDTVKHRVKLELEKGMPATFCVTATLCYTASHLQSILTRLETSSLPNNSPHQLQSAKAVSLRLASVVFDALDFVQPLTDSSSHLFHHMLLPPPHDCPTEWSNPFEILLPNSTEAPTLTFPERCREMLKRLLPQSLVEEALTEISGSIKVKACNYDGSALLFEVKEEQEGISLAFTSTGNVRCQAETISSICCRLNAGNKATASFLQVKAKEVAAIAGQTADLLASTQNQESGQQVTDLFLELFEIFCDIRQTSL